MFVSFMSVELSGSERGLREGLSKLSDEGIAEAMCAGHSLDGPSQDAADGGVEYVQCGAAHSPSVHSGRREAGGG